MAESSGLPIEGMSTSARIERYPTPCVPPSWARGGHAQTVFGNLLPPQAPRITGSGRYERRDIVLPDGDRLVGFVRGGDSGVRVHLFHGLSGDVDSDYMRQAAARFLADGHEVWALNHRGCGAGQGLARRPYHAGRSEDVQAVLALSRNEAPDRVHLAVGFSLSGNALLLYAAEGREPRLDGFVAVNPPIDIERATVDIGRGFSRLYEIRFLWRLGRAVRRHVRAGFTKKAYRIPPWISFLEFDDLFTAPECGFENGRDYYRLCSTHRRLHQVDTRGVILTAADDPIVTPAVYAGVRLAPTLLLHVEAAGGHVGYLERSGWGAERWLDGALSYYVSALAREARAAGAGGTNTERPSG